MTQTFLEFLQDWASLTADRLGGLSEALRAALSASVAELTRFLTETQYFGQPVPDETQKVRPARGSTTWLAWRDGAWRPIERLRGGRWMWLA